MLAVVFLVIDTLFIFKKRSAKHPSLNTNHVLSSNNSVHERRSCSVGNSDHRTGLSRGLPHSSVPQKCFVPVSRLSHRR